MVRLALGVVAVQAVALVALLELVAEAVLLAALVVQAAYLVAVLEALGLTRADRYFLKQERREVAVLFV